MNRGPKLKLSKFCYTVPFTIIIKYFALIASMTACNLNALLNVCYTNIQIKFNVHLYLYSIMQYIIHNIYDTIYSIFYMNIHTRRTLFKIRSITGILVIVPTSAARWQYFRIYILYTSRLSPFNMCTTIFI